MARWIVAGLVVLNLVLGAAVYAHLHMERPAQAEIGNPTRNIATVAGQSVVAGVSIVYIMDVNTGNLVALKNDVANGKVTPVARRNVADDIKRIPK